MGRLIYQYCYKIISLFYTDRNWVNSDELVYMCKLTYSGGLARRETWSCNN